MSMLPPDVGSPSPPGSMAPGRSRVAASSPNPDFARVWAQVMPAADNRAEGSTVQVRQGDTLIGLVKAHHRQQGLPIGEAQAFRLARQVAADNGIANPNLIHPGQRIDFARLQLPPLARATPAEQASTVSTEQALASRHWGVPSPVPARLPWAPSTTAPPSAANATNSAPQTTALADGAPASEHPVLERTLQRAVGKGFVLAADMPAVRERILALAERYQFAPDDFARLSLMESGGLNPQASNGHCHGIIQFCDGPARGAASVGYRQNPRDILGLNLLQQLDLVDRYFAQAGLSQNPGKGRIGLDDLYLTVLTPAARSEKRRDAPLDIAGPQASYLHVDRDRQKPITRNSIVQGLHAYTHSVLQGSGMARSPDAQLAQNLSVWPR